MRHFNAQAIMIAAVSVIILQGCFENGKSGSRSRRPRQSEQTALSGPAKEYLYYLGTISTAVAGRTLTEEEYARIVEKPSRLVARQTLEGWSKSPYFAESARNFINLRLGVSGSKDGVSYDLPGNLAAYIVRNDLPYSKILTADFCVSDAGEKTPCDTGAPYAAGVLTTRAYMKGHATRFNLRRARKFLTAFSCHSYPVTRSKERGLDIVELIPMFRQNQPEGTPGGFGNGTACYTCHSQFGLHAQFFVKYDETGMWKAEATGAQAQGKEPGLSTNGLFTSHFNDPAVSNRENSRFFNREATNLKDAADILSQDASFLECAVQSVIQYYLRMDSAEVVDPKAVKEIAASLGKSSQPSFAKIVVESLSHPGVISGITSSWEKESP